MDREKRIKIMECLDDEFPDAKAPLKHKTAYQLLVAVILSAQCTDERVNKVTPALFKVAGDVESMVSLGFSRLVGYVRSCGYYNSKARHILGTSEMLLKDFKGIVPDTLEELVRLPGVGEKTASCVLTQWYKKPGIAVDTHYFRVANRTGLVKGDSPAAVYKKSFELLPIGIMIHEHDIWVDGSLQVTLHGRYVCTARRPKCGECVINDLCEWEGKGLKVSASGGSAIG
jgi:endonuclease III